MRPRQVVDEGAITVRVIDPACPASVAVIVLVPIAKVVTVPDVATVATDVLLEVQVGLIATVVPLLYVAVAVIVRVSPSFGVVVDPVTVRFVTVTVDSRTVMTLVLV